MVDITLRSYEEDIKEQILSLDKNATITEDKDMLRIESDKIKGFISAEPSGHGYYLELYVDTEKNIRYITLDFNDVEEVLTLA